MTGMSWDSKEMANAVRERAARAEKALREDAMDRARRIACLLKGEYGVARVLVYGSLVDGYFHSRSDIDLLIDDHSGSYWDMYAKADKVASPFALSIICAHDAQPSLRESAESRGVQL